MLQSASRRGCLLRGGAWSRGPVGGCLVPGGGVSALRGLAGPGGSAPGGVCSGGGGCLVRGGICSGGVCSWGGIQACTEADTPPTPHPVDRHTLVKILPWPNFVAAGNNDLAKETAI